MKSGTRKFLRHLAWHVACKFREYEIYFFLLGTWWHSLIWFETQSVVKKKGNSRFCSMHNVFTLFKNLHIEKVAAMMVSSQFIPLHFSIAPRWHFSAGNPMKSFVKTIWTWLWQLQAIVSYRSCWLLIPLLKLCYIRWCMRKAPEIFRTENTRWDVYSLLTQKRYNII